MNTNSRRLLRLTVPGLVIAAVLVPTAASAQPGESADGVVVEEAADASADVSLTPADTAVPVTTDTAPAPVADEASTVPGVPPVAEATTADAEPAATTPVAEATTADAEPVA